MSDKDRTDKVREEWSEPVAGSQIPAQVMKQAQEMMRLKEERRVPDTAQEQVRPTRLPPASQMKQTAQPIRCDGCKWFTPSNGMAGNCRKKSPTETGFPVVFVSDWCGDHVLKL